MKNNKLSKNEKKVLKIWGIVLVTIVVVLFVINIFFPIKTLFSNLLNSSSDDTTFGEVTDYSRYSTVTISIDKFYAYLNMKDYDAVIKILDSSYVEENGITEDNVDEFLTTSDKQLAFEANIMYLVSSKNGIQNYVVDGTIVYANTGDAVEKAYYYVVLDANNDEGKLLYSVKPITEKEYKKGANIE